MPVWYYDKKDLVRTPSSADGIDQETESRYRREGARFIIDAGTKLGLRYDSCATGVIYFHRFYMYHSFREFHRYVMSACCLFLAGKVEETPKKCRDIIKTVRGMLNDQQFLVFGTDPREEVMTMERILLQTIKFDLQVEHPYAYLLKYAKLIKGDKSKIQKMVQMAWTFVNDSLCTDLCLQWEPEIIAIALLYLASRLSKYDITDWEGKVNSKDKNAKWWDHLVEGLSLDLLEDICHQVLDLYSSNSSKRSESPPMITNRAAYEQQKREQQLKQQQIQQQQAAKRPCTPPVPPNQQGPPSKSQRKAEHTPHAVRDSRSNTHQEAPHVSSIPTVASHPPPVNPNAPSDQYSQTHTTTSTAQPSYESNYPQYQGQGQTDTNYSSYNPYMSSQMYSSSFMSQEGTQNIQGLLSQSGTHSGYSNAPPAAPAQTAPTQTAPAPAYGQPSYQQPPAPQSSNYYPQQQQQYPYQQQTQQQQGYPQQQQQYQQQPPPGPNQPYSQPPPQPAQPNYQQPTSTQNYSYQGQGGYQQNYNTPSRPPGNQHQYQGYRDNAQYQANQYQNQYQQPPPGPQQNYNQPPPPRGQFNAGPPPGQQYNQRPQTPRQSGLAPVRIQGRNY